jgi:hypothetical protein
MKKCDPAGRGPRSPSRIALWLVVLSGMTVVLVPTSCAPIERLVIGDSSGLGGMAGAGPACESAGEPCESPLDCCGLACVDGACLDGCVSDAGACQVGGQCCSGTCTAGTCAALSDRCLTAGNACLASVECCSGLCDEAGHCSLASSYCVQPFDVCRGGADCCTGVCDLEPGAALGVCGATPAGASNCAAGVSGLLCDDCNECCSRLCEPYGSHGVRVCTPPSGCRVTGEICQSDTDCCGGDPQSGLPGAGNSACDRAAGADLGVCRNAMGCSPQGNVCHMVDYACSVSAAANKCCDGPSLGACELDALGMPRCTGLGAGCVAAGSACASSADCCGGSPCTTDGSGVLRCRSETCAGEGTSCTVAGDCCAGLSCATVAGSLSGVCFVVEL